MLERTFFFCALLVSVPLALSAAPARPGAPAEPDIIVSSVVFGGNAVIASTELVTAIELRPGSVWTVEKEKLDKEILTSLYHSRGYSDAEADVYSLLDGTSAYIRIDIKEGKVYSFGPTSITGLSALKERAVKKELEYKKGAPYSYEQLLKAQSRLYGTNWFEELRTAISSSPVSRTIDVSITVREKPMLWVKSGIGYGSEEKERFSLGLTHNNFLGKGYQAQVTGTVSRIWLEYHAEFLDRHFLFSRTELRNGITWRRENRKGYDLETLQNLLSLGRKLTRYLSVSVQYKLQRALIYNVDPLLSVETPSQTQTRSIALVVNRDSTNDFFYPTRGLRSQASLERSGGIWGGDLDYYKGTTSHTAYRELFWGITGLVSAGGGFIRETGRTREIPIYDRFFLGGGNSVRGYAERGVGPKDANGNPLGGKVSLQGNAELRFPIYKSLKGALFIDAGQVADTLRGAAPANWKYGAGGGLRYRTPVGPVRLDLGYKLNPDKPAVIDTWRIHFTIGEAF